MLYDNIIGKEFSQNCGDSLLVLEKTNKKQIDTYLYLCKFKKYPYEVLALIISDYITGFVRCNEYALYAVVIFLSFLYLYISCWGFSHG